MRRMIGRGVDNFYSLAERLIDDSPISKKRRSKRKRERPCERRVRMWVRRAFCESVER